MQKNVIIKITGTQDVGDGPDSVELTTHGRFYQKSEGFYICYDDSEATGFAGCKTIVKVEGQERVTMTRKNAKSRSELVVERNKRHLCHYDTGFGDLVIGICGSQIHSDLQETGGSVTFRYTLDVNTDFESENMVSIQVEERADESANA